jgi:lysozyme
MDYSDAGLVLTRSFEGLRLTAYRDCAFVITIGYGHTGPDVHEGQTITEPEAEALLRRDLQKAVDTVNQLVAVRPLTQGQFDACCDFVFNLGAGSWMRSDLRFRLLRGDFEGAAQQFGKWVYAGGKVEPGLVKRRKAEMEMFTGVQQ